MEQIKKELEDANKKTQDAIQNIESAKTAISDKYYSITNIYTEGGGVTVEKLGQAIDNKIEEVEALNSVIDSLKKIIEVKDSQIKLLLNVLTDNKDCIEKMRVELNNLKNML